MGYNEANVDKLTNRIEKEVSHRVDVKKKRLSRRLAFFVSELEDANGMEMTEELGKVILSQYSQVMDILRKEGAM